MVWFIFNCVNLTHALMYTLNLRKKYRTYPRLGQNSRNYVAQNGCMKAKTARRKSCLAPGGLGKTAFGPGQSAGAVELERRRNFVLRQSVAKLIHGAQGGIGVFFVGGNV